MTDLTATVSLSGITDASAIRSIEYDDSRGLLYLVTETGSLLRWNPLTDNFASSIALGGTPLSIDLTLDGAYALIAGFSGPYDLTIQRVNLSTLAAEQLNLVPNSVPGPPTTEGYTFDIAVLANGQALASTRSNFGPIREFNPEAPTISGTPIAGGSFGQFTNPTYLITSDNRRYVLVVDGGGLGVAPVQLFDSVANQLIASAGAFFPVDTHGAISDTDGLIYSSGEVFDTQFHLVRDLTSFGSFVAGQFSRDGHDLFLWNGNAQTIQVFDTASWQQIKSIPIALSPYVSDMETSQDGRFLFLSTGLQFEAIDLAAKLYWHVADGSAGDQTLTGPGMVTYANATAGVSVSLALQGQAQNTGGAGTDTLSNFDDLTGSAFNDTLEGNGAANTLDGGAGINTVSYAHSASGVTVSLALQGQTQNTLGAGVDTLSNFQNIIGSAFNDQLTGDAGDNTIDGGSSGNDVLDGGGGINTVSFASANSGVAVSLALQGQAQATGLGNDTLSNFQNLSGSAFNDTLEGDGGSNVLDGGAGVNVVSYAHATAGVTVSLSLQGQTQITGGAGTDTLLNFQNLTGSAFSDTLEGNGGNNVLDGGPGANTVSYAHASGGVNVSLALQGQAENTGGAGVDTLSNFRNLIGSAFNDVLADNSEDNVLTGGLGADTFVLGGGGADTIADFSHAQGDVINLGRFGTFHSVDDVLAAATQVGANTVITAGGGSLTLDNVQRSSLTAADFSFAYTVIYSSDVISVAGGTTLNLTSSPVVSFLAASGGTFVNNGAITLTSAASASVIQSVSGANPTAILQNVGTFTVNDGGGTAISAVTTQNSGTISITGSSAPVATSGDLVNSGAFSVQGANQAIGVDDANAGAQVTNQLGATLSVSATAGQVIGVKLEGTGEFDNLGSMTVSGGGQAYGAYLLDGSVDKVVNSGSLTVAAPSGVGLYLAGSGPAPASTPAFGVYTVVNSGTITGPTAIQVADGAAVSINNAGTINGGVVLGNGANYFINNGTINGDVSINAGRFFSQGVVHGTFSLGSGSVNVYTGAQDDTIFLAAGTHVVDGGGGTNTVSYAGAASGVSVSLEQFGQTQNTGVGTDTLMNIQNLVGSSFDDLLTASSGTTVLTGGGGADSFKIPLTSSNVTITDFSHAQGDVILGFSNFAFIQAHAIQSGADTVISMGLGSLTLKNIAASSLAPSDFYFSDSLLHLEVTTSSSTVVVPAGVAFTGAASPMVTFDPPAGGSFINRGFLSLTGGGSLVRGVSPLQLAPDPTALFQNDGYLGVSGGTNTYGIIGVTLHNSGTLAVSGISVIGANGDVINSGAITASGTSLTAAVVDENPGGLIQNLVGGTVTISAGPTFGIALELAVGGEIDNAGAVTVNGSGQGGIGLAVVDSGGNGYGLGYSVVNNSGSVVLNVNHATGILINVTPVGGVTQVVPDGQYNVINSGTVTAAYAITFRSNGIAAAINNSGTLNGDILLTAANDRILNTGTINGAIDLSQGGNDTLDSHAGTINGVIILGSGSSTVSLGAENNTVGLAGGVHVVDGGGGSNQLSYSSAGAGVHVSLALQGQAQDTGVGTDTLSNFQGLIGTAFNDTLEGDVNYNSLDGLGGTNTVSFAHAASGVTVSLALQGGLQNTIGAGFSALYNFQNMLGSSFADHLTGDGNRNVIDGGGGDDVLTGGGGADTFVVNPNGGADIITDFTHAQGDRIDLAALHLSQSLASLLDSATQVGADTVFSLGGGNSLTLQGVAKTSLTVVDLALPKSTSDFGQTGTDALLFRNAASGDWGYMSANLSGGETWHPIGSSSSDYVPLGRGDFNGDGVLDTAFRQTSTGSWGFLTINPGGGESWHPAGNASLAYDPVATGDILGSGSAAIVFRNAATGDWGFMTTNGASQAWHPIGPTGAAYSVAGYGDFNGDGMFDVAFRNGATGDWGFMTVNPTGGETWHGVGSASTAYAPVAAADFLGTGQTELAFRNPTTGDWGFMQALNTGGESWHPIGVTGPGYSVIGNGDFNGDGVQDVAFRNTATGDWGYMTVNPSGGETWHGVGSASLAYGTI